MERYGKVQAAVSRNGERIYKQQPSGDFSGQVIGNQVFGETHDSGYSNTSLFRGSMGSYQGKAAVLSSNLSSSS